jgi:hypothetical protein
MKTKHSPLTPYAIVGLIVWVPLLVPAFGQSGRVAEGTPAAFSLDSGSEAHAENSSGRPEGPKTDPTVNKNSGNASTPGQASATGTNASSSRLTFSERLRIYGHAFIAPESLLGPVFGAGISQLDDEPPEWRQGAEGYGRRVASGMGRSIIARTITFGFAAADGEDPRYTRSTDRGIMARTEHAVVWTFVARTGDTRIPAFSRFAGYFGAGFIANAWYPESRSNTAHALERSSTALASSVGFHVLKEFWPDIAKVLHLH